MIVKIRQMYSGFGWHLKKQLVEKYGFTPPVDINKPVLFFGCYGQAQMERALKWSKKSHVRIWWSGSDILFFKHPDRADVLNELKANKNISHIATVNFIGNDLKQMGLPYEKVPLFSHKLDAFKPAPLGELIYIYHPGSPIYCPKPILARLKKEFKNTPFILADNHHSYSQAEMQGIYNRAIVGVRLVKHDGLSHSAAELGLSGRKIIWNGDTPNAVGFKNNDDIFAQIENILKEKYNPFNLALKVRRYLDVGEEWLNVEI